MHNNPFQKYLVLLLTGLLSGALAAQETASEDSRKLVEILHVDRVKSMTHEGKTINRLLGNVQLMHNGALMSCDSAYLFSSSEFEAYSRVTIVQNSTRLFGDFLHYNGQTNIAQVRGRLVRLLDSTATLRTQYLDFNTKDNIGHFFNGGVIDNNDSQLESIHGHYYSNDKLFVFTDSVEMHNETYDIRCEAGNYHTRTDVATFLAHTNIWHKDGFLSCDYGWYDKKRDYFYFSQNAYILSKEQEIWADSVFYDRQAAMGDLHGHVQALDTVQQSIAFGNEAHFFEDPQRLTLTRQAAVAYYTNDDNQPDTLFMRADTIRFITECHPKICPPDTVAQSPGDSLPVTDTLSIPLPDADRPATAIGDTISPAGDSLLSIALTDSLPDTPVDSTIRKVFAYFNVRAFRQDVQAVCDSFAYSSLDSLGRMFGRPAMWNKQQQITSKEIHFLSDPQQRMMIRADFLEAAFIITQERDTFFNQVKGRDIIGHFRDNDLRLIDVFGGAQTVYYLQEDSVVANGNIAESATMQIEVQERKIRRIKYFEKWASNTYPLDQLPPEKTTLKGFEWREAERPKSRWEICPEIPRTSQRQASDTIPKPSFPIRKRMDAIPSSK
jgi:lipopolysaccharide export system protein LptA